VIQILRDVKYSGWFTLEYERNDPYGEMPKFVETLKPLLVG
jgi:sugar phosphate isomerase/epimerase